MRRKGLAVALAVLAALVAAAVAAAYAYDRTHDDVVAEGVTAGGVDIGGLRADEARARLRDALGERLGTPVVVEYRGRTFRVSPSQVDVRLHSDAMVSEALRESGGNIFTRALRDLVSGRVDAEVAVEASYSERAVAAAVSRIAETVERRARDAKVVVRGGRLRVLPERNGVAVRARALAREIAAALTDTSGDRAVAVVTEMTKPKLTRAKLARKHPYFIVVSRPEKKLRLYRRLELAKSYLIAVGQAGVETPAGLYEIETKAVNPAWHVPERAWAGELAGQIIPAGSPQNPIKARWMEFHDGAGIHGTDDVASLGEAASHGCIRMSIPDVIELYDRVPLQTPVYIA